MIDQIANDLKSDEGWVPHAYQDHLGFWTIGYGFLIDERKGGQIPEHIGEDWLRWEVADRFDALHEELPWLHSQPESVIRALVNMTYQLGLSGVLRFKKMLSALEEGDREKAAEEALDSRWAEQTPNRAHRVASWIRGDK